MSKLYTQWAIACFTVLFPGRLQARSGYFSNWLLLFGLFAVVSCNPKKDPSPPPEITFFELTDLPGQEVELDPEQGLIRISVPHGTLLKDRRPNLTLTAGATLVPSAGVPQDFAQVVYYTLTAPSGTKKVYQVQTVWRPEPVVALTGLETDWVRAGDSVMVWGSALGKSSLQLQVSLRNQATGTEARVGHRLLDSVSLRLAVPLDLPPASYWVQVRKGSHQAQATTPLRVRIPAPNITDIRLRSLLQGDTLQLAGVFIDPDHYTYTVLLEGNGLPYALPALTSGPGSITIVLPPHLPPGTYSVRLGNQTEGIEGIPAPGNLRVYDRHLPFVTRVTGLTPLNRSGDVLVFHTARLASVPARFYTLILAGSRASFSVNALADPTAQTLTITLPADLPPAAYPMQLVWLDENGAIAYSLLLNEHITLR